jgi:hypothetical protein
MHPARQHGALQAVPDDEPDRARRFVGILVICAGIFIVAQSA